MASEPPHYTHKLKAVAGCATGQMEMKMVYFIYSKTNPKIAIYGHSSMFIDV